jgi:hypothetical protein
MKLSSCSDCGKELAPGILHCPYCPTGVRNARLVRDLAFILVALTAFVFVAVFYFYFEKGI